MVSTMTKANLDSMYLSTMQVKHGLKEGQEMWLASIKVDKDPSQGDETIPMATGEVVKEFKNIMPPKLLKRLPSRKK